MHFSKHIIRAQLNTAKHKAKAAKPQNWLHGDQSGRESAGTFKSTSRAEENMP